MSPEESPTTASAQVASKLGWNDGLDAIPGAVRLSMPRVGGWRVWGAVSAEFERRLAGQDSPAIAIHLDSWILRGRDYLQLVIVATVDAGDVADALDLAWQAFRKAAGDDAAG